MKTESVRLCQDPEDFIALLAQKGHTTVQEIYATFATCILCRCNAIVAVIGLDRHSWFRKSKSGKLRIMIYGLCESCFALPDAIEKAQAIVTRPLSKFLH